MPTLDEELKLENEYRHMAMEKFKAILSHKEETGEASHTAMGAGLINHLYDNLAQNMRVWLDVQLTPKRGVKPMYYQFLKYANAQYDDDETFISLLCLSLLSNVINQAAIKGGDDKYPSLSHVGEIIGVQITQEVHLQEFLNYLHGEDYQKYINSTLFQDWLKTNNKKMFEFTNIPIGIARGLKTRNSDYYRRYYVKEVENKIVEAGIPWSPRKFDKNVWFTLGGKLVEVLLSSTDLFELQSVGGEVDKLHPTQKFIDIWKTNTDYALLHAYSSCPTIIPPKDWTDINDGGYYGELAVFNSMLRLYRFQDGGYYYKKYMSKLKSADLSKPMKALNSIQSTPWKIDKKVLEVAHEIVKMGGDRAGLPRTEPFAGLPKLHNPTEQELKEHKHKAYLHYKKESSRKGKMIRVLANIKTADRFKDYERIYFPCNMDFRGRVYPIPSFSFQGDDLNKGLIQFADAPKITAPESEHWFLIAGAEFAGIDKVSFAEEIKWVKDNEQNILDTAEDPIAMLDWWGNLDCPFEFLQFCFEYRKMIDYKASHNGSIIGWSTGVPVAFDGTCSGLQHFSAILRDPVGAEAVNLKPSDRPQDIYGRVAQVVNQVLKHDSEQGTVDEWDDDKNRMKPGTKTMAQLWLNFGVNRKVTKRSVMTLAYGSKEYGFKEQILTDTIEPHMNEGVFTEANAHPMAAYMAKLIWNAVRKVVVKAVEGMEWLQKVTRLICKNENVVQWTTPMGLLIHQPYLTTKTKIYRLRFAQTQKRIYVPYTVGDVNSRKQANSIAPNFIHSMDASHLQLTVCTAKDQGINHFAMIHDSYGTTVADAGVLFKIVRECFVKMYTEHDVLKEFAEEVSHLTEKELPELPSKGSFDINEVLSSLYAFH
jgi:DNA-directed RNA polymerase